MSARILLIESDTILADNVARGLIRAGHKVDWQRHPQAAIDRADSQMPDLVIMDLQLAGRNGVEFLHEFRSYPEWHSLPLIIFSNIQPEEVSSAKGYGQLGVSVYHYKPATSVADLLGSVNAALNSTSV